MTNENIQPVHNESVVQGIASEFWQKDISGENSLHTCPNGCTICSLCKVGATVPLEEILRHICTNYISYLGLSKRELEPWTWYTLVYTNRALKKLVKSLQWLIDSNDEFINDLATQHPWIGKMLLCS